MKKIAITRFLIVIACLMGGALAGGDVYRYIIEVPAWRHLNIDSWQKYSEHADLGNGLVLFPIEAIGSAIPLIVASIIFLRNSTFKFSTWLLHLSTLFALIGLVFTFFAAPLMLNLPNIHDNDALIQETFNKFHFWGTLRAVAQLLSFFFSVLALANISKTNSRVID
jgi:hypothetical protein